ncbi:VWA domain-containing protein [Lacipirellula parvula]|uniref:VWFA domain-containing protein n=1 Tax=Lacipirellula parvula TaxID=2650471 RepID=A0A5K7XIB8_9BACT|nr:VWA domain-containing protein [Lacipirellula parvula]BBO33953.1 hypothetical protein PLANPX_3565 [Lacipirellula parvula]
MSVQALNSAESRLASAAAVRADAGAQRDESGQRDDDEASRRGSWFSIEAAPPWLVSMISHMAMILVLGLAYQAAPKDVGVELTINPGDPGLTDFDAGGGGNGGDGLGQPLDEMLNSEMDNLDVGAAEVPIEGETLTDMANPQLESLIGMAAPDAEFRESFAANAGSLLASSGGTIEGTGTGDGGSGTGTGGGHGAGKGTGTGDGEGPGHAYTSMFGLAGEGGNFVYAFDRSQSMNSVFTYQIDGDRSLTVTPLEAAKNELIRSLGDLNEGCRFQIVFYNDIAVMFGGAPTMYTATYENKEQAKSFVENMKAEANTNHNIALENALQCNPDMIFLMTDGEAKDDPSPSDVRRIVRHCKKNNIKINVVHFCFEIRENCSLIQLAEGTGGQHRFVTLRELAHQKMQADRGTPTLRPVEALPSLD